MNSLRARQRQIQDQCQHRCQPWVHMRASYWHPRGMNHFPPQTVKELRAVSCLARASMLVGDAQETEGSRMSQTQPNTPKSRSKACCASRDWQPNPPSLRHPTYGTKTGVKDEFLWIGAENLCGVLTAWLHGEMEAAISESRILMLQSPASRLAMIM